MAKKRTLKPRYTPDAAAKAVDLQLQGYELVKGPAELAVAKAEAPDYGELPSTSVKPSLPIEHLLQPKPAMLEIKKQEPMPDEGLTPAQKLWHERNRKRFVNNPTIRED